MYATDVARPLRLQTDSIIVDAVVPAFAAPVPPIRSHYLTSRSKSLSVFVMGAGYEWVMGLP